MPWPVQLEHDEKKKRGRTLLQVGTARGILSFPGLWFIWGVPLYADLIQVWVFCLLTSHHPGQEVFRWIITYRGRRRLEQVADHLRDVCFPRRRWLCQPCTLCTAYYCYNFWVVCLCSCLACSCLCLLTSGILRTTILKTTCTYNDYLPSKISKAAV